MRLARRPVRILAVYIAYEGQEASASARSIDERANASTWSLYNAKRVSQVHSVILEQVVQLRIEVT